MRGRAALLCLFLAGGAGAAGPETVVDAFHEALRIGDREQAVALIAPDVVIFEQGRTEWSREEYRRHHLSADLEAAGKLRRKVRRRHVTGAQGDVATVLTEAELRGTPGSQSEHRISLETVVLTRAGERWLIRHIHWSSRTER